MDELLGRKVTTSFSFSGKNVDVLLKKYLESVSYTDVSSGSSDSLSITLQNIDDSWTNVHYPQKGNTVSGKLIFHDWRKQGADKKLKCGTFTMDQIRTAMIPKTMTLSCLSVPSKASFRTRDRDKVWEMITLDQIANEIAGRYGLGLKYFGPPILIGHLEQSENDSSFLFKTCEDYGFGMKVYRRKIVIFDIVQMEQKAPVMELKKKDFEDMTFTDGLYTTLTGARCNFEGGSVFRGLKAEGAPGARDSKVSRTAATEAEAIRMAAAKVNLANRSLLTLSATLFPRPRICAGVTIRLGAEFGAKLSGKYFVDKITWDIGESGTTQKLECHKVKKKVKE